MLEAMFAPCRLSGRDYTSPHLLRYNERVRIGEREASDERCAPFAVERRAAATPLTYFEFGTLAAILLFVEQAVEPVLEVGLGGGSTR